MMNKILSLVLFFSLITSNLISQPTALNLSDRNERKERKKQNDNLRVMTFQLANGLTVYLNEDHSQQKVTGAVVVKGGASCDPENATGIAHYFEHIMFKGTSKIGTINWEAEKILLDSIRIMYDLLERSGENIAFKSQIQKKINDLSVRAAEYAIPNEFNKIISDMGGSGLNAYTSYENIVYHNSFPPESIEKWLKVYAHRIDDPVFRLFQSELETVYEEKNMSMDNIQNIVFEEIYKGLYPDAPYGKHTILGDVEHLKNPSLTKMMTFFKQYYCAGNMALVLVGDFEIEKIRPMIERYFGELRDGKAPASIPAKSTDFKGRVAKQVNLTPIPVGAIAFKTISKTSNEKPAMDVLNNILSNTNGTGLFDELARKGDLIAIHSFSDLHLDMGGQIIFFVPKIPLQSLKSAENLILKQLEKLKTGDFDDSIFIAVKNELIKENLRSLESIEYRQYMIIQAFMQNKPWEEFLNYTSILNQIEKKDVIELANKYFGENYFVLHSKIGTPKKIKLQKPDYKPVALSTIERNSQFAESLKDMQTQEVRPEFINFQSDLSIQQLDGNDVYIVENTANQIFTAEIKFEVGYEQIPQLKYIAQYLNEVGSISQPYQMFRKKLQYKAVNIYATAGKDYFSLMLDGYDQDFGWAMSMLMDLINNPEKNMKIIKKIAKEEKVSRKSEDKELQMKSGMLYSYAFYGENSYYLKRYSVSQIKGISYNEILDCIKRMQQFKAQYHIVSKLSDGEIFKAIIKYGLHSKNPKKGFYPTNVEAQATTKNQILILNDEDAIQSHIKILIPANAVNMQDRYKVRPFNQYFGSGMSSIIFQEIREFRSFAYSAYGYYSTFSNFESKNYFVGGLTTQADKTNEAVKTYFTLLAEMPRKPERAETIKNQILLSVNSNNSGFRNISKTVAYYRSQGLHEDPNRNYYESYLQLKFEDIQDFYDRNVFGKPYYLLIVGDIQKINMEELKKLGEVREVNLKTIRKK